MDLVEALKSGEFHFWKWIYGASVEVGSHQKALILEEYKAFVKMMAMEVKEEKELLQYLGTDDYSESEESGSDEESP